MGRKLTLDEVLKRFKNVHGDKYDYSKVDYKHTDTKVCIICPTHGEFWQTPHMHLSGQGCSKCYGNERKTTKQYIDECKKIHGDFYNYDKVVYKNAYSIVTITCPIHGDFKQRARTHLYGHGCPECQGKRKYDKEFFIKRANEVHGDKYDYSLIETVKNNHEKQPIVCPKHGVFYQSIDSHITQRQGCPYCIRSILEEDTAKLLKENGYEFEEKKRFEWLGNQHLDFYIPKGNIAIECQGIQHLKPYGTFGNKNVTKEELFEKVYKLDDLKYRLCKENGIKLVYYTNCKDEYRYPICRNGTELLEKLNNLLLTA